MCPAADQGVSHDGKLTQQPHSDLRCNLRLQKSQKLQGLQGSQNSDP